MIADVAEMTAYCTWDPFLRSACQALPYGEERPDSSAHLDVLSVESVDRGGEVGGNLGEEVLLDGLDLRGDGVTDSEIPVHGEIGDRPGHADRPCGVQVGILSKSLEYRCSVESLPRLSGDGEPRSNEDGNLTRNNIRGIGYPLEGLEDHEHLIGSDLDPGTLLRGQRVLEEMVIEPNQISEFVDLCTCGLIEGDPCEGVATWISMGLRNRGVTDGFDHNGEDIILRPRPADGLCGGAHQGRRNQRQHQAIVSQDWTSEPYSGAMPTAFLVRHGRSSANTAGILAGRKPGVHLDDIGIQQAKLAARRLSLLRLSAIVASPLERTMQTAMEILDDQPGNAEIVVDERFIECDYGTWSGKRLAVLARRPLWRTIQTNPSSVRFPGVDGESLAGMQARAREAIYDWGEVLGSRSQFAVVTHGDIIKAILADALGMHLDMFQRIAVDPGSISVVQYSKGSAMVLRMNDSSCDFAEFSSKRRSVTPIVGGGAGGSDSTKRPGGSRK